MSASLSNNHTQIENIFNLILGVMESDQICTCHITLNMYG